MTRNPSLTITIVSNRHTPRAIFIGRATPCPSRAGCSARSMLQAGKTYPMIMVVHGGPAAVVTSHFLWDNMIAGWLRNGYFVFEPNPRGSYGQGESFTRANVRDFGGGDLRDDMAGIDAVKQVAPIDEAENIMKGEDVPKILGRLASERKNLHWKRFWWSMIGLPFTIPFGLVPVSVTLLHHGDHGLCNLESLIYRSSTLHSDVGRIGEVRYPAECHGHQY